MGSRRRLPFALQRADGVLLITTVSLLVIGLLAVYSATSVPGTPEHGLNLKQGVWIVIGGILFLIAAGVPIRMFDGPLAVSAYGFSILLLVLTLVVGTTRLGATRWLNLGIFLLQTSEVAKIGTVLMLAYVLGGRPFVVIKTSRLFLCLGLCAVPAALVLKQPDLGSAMSFAALPLPMLAWAGFPFFGLLLVASPLMNLTVLISAKLWILYIVILGTVLFQARDRIGTFVAVLLLVVNIGAGLAAPRAWGHLHEYQRQRITTFLDPAKDPYGAGYQIIQSKIALGAGGVTGKGYLQGTQKKLSFLPEQHTDFIYCVIGEEWGFVGTAVVVGLYLLLLTNGVVIAYRARNRFASLVAFGMVGVFLYNVLVNIWMTVGLAPVTGLPLPLISYGGSSLLMSMVQLGLLANVSIHRHDY